MDEERLPALLQESLAVATRAGAMKPADLTRVIVDTTVQHYLPDRCQAFDPSP